MFCPWRLCKVDRPLPFACSDLQRHVGQLLLGQVQRVIGHRDAVLTRIASCRQISPQDGIVGHAEEGHHTMPGLVVEPHLQRYRQAAALRTACTGFAFTSHVS